MTLQAFYIFLMVSVSGPSPQMHDYLGKTETGLASYYSPQFNGRSTAFGEVFSNQELTAAHRTLPYNTLLEVTNVKNNQKVTVRITDRGPYSKHRVIDLSKSAARALGMLRSGVAKVKVRVVGTDGLALVQPKAPVVKPAQRSPDLLAGETAMVEEEGFLY